MPNKKNNSSSSSNSQQSFAAANPGMYQQLIEINDQVYAYTIEIATFDRAKLHTDAWADLIAQATSCINAANAFRHLYEQARMSSRVA